MKEEDSLEKEIKWIEPFAQLYGAKIENNFILLPNKLNLGTRYFLDCGNGVVAYYINYESQKDLFVVQNKINSDFVGVYYNLTKGDCVLTASESVYDIGHLKYNLVVVDCSLDASFYVPAGNGINILCIFIEKSRIKRRVDDSSFEKLNLDIFTFSNKVPILLNRMSNESYHILKDLSKIESGGLVFDLHFQATVQLLLTNYLKKISNRRVIIDNIKEEDLEKIIALQMYLLNKIEKPFPSMSELKEFAQMSESKLLAIFKKVNGISPSKYFLENKMILAKQLLEEKELSISEISNQLSFASSSHFSLKFKQQFNKSPNEFIKQL